MYCIKVSIREESREAAISSLEKIAKQIKTGVTYLSEHPNNYMPYKFFSCGSVTKGEVDRDCNALNKQIRTK